MCSACQSICCCVGAHTHAAASIRVIHTCVFFSREVCVSERASVCQGTDGWAEALRALRRFSHRSGMSLCTCSAIHTVGTHIGRWPPPHTQIHQSQHKNNTYTHCLTYLFDATWSEGYLHMGFFFFPLLMRKNGFKKQTQMHNFLILPPSLSAHFPHIPSCLLSPFQPNSSPHCSPRAHSICGHFC